MKQQMPAPNRLSANVPFSAPFLPLAMALVETGAQGFGFSGREAGGLVLAMEELFSFYARQAASGSAMAIDLEDQGYRLALALTFRMADPDLRALNLTWNCSLDNEDSLDLLGPMIAARTVSSLRLAFGADEQVTLRLTRNRDYPPAASVSLPPADLAGPLRLFDPSWDDLHHFAAMAVTAEVGFLPGFLARPDMAADMLAAGHLSALLIEQGNWIRGGVLWRPLTDSCLELYGPYVFGDDADDQGLTLLLDQAVGRISRSAYRGLVRRQGPLAGADRFFDFLGELSLRRPDGLVRCSCYYRQLREESSGTVYCGEPLATFLGEQYDRLCLPRQIRPATMDPARLRQSSVLAAELEQEQSLAIIRPLGAGRDMAANLAGHLHLLRGGGIANFLVELDTGRSEDTAFAATLAETGFVPRLVIPDAGLGDLVVYDHPTGEAKA